MRQNLDPIVSVIAAAVALALVTCAAPVAQAPATPPVASASASATTASIADAKWARFRSKRFELSVAFPEGKSWRIDDHTTPWLTARHVPTDSVVRARIWHEATIVNAAACERRAREWLRDIPDASEIEIIDERRAENVPAGGYDTVVRAGVMAPKSNSASAQLSSVVLAFGASMKKCFAATFISQISGANASAQSGERLAIGTRIIESAIHQSELDQPSRQPPLSEDQR
jgi:hypothetical protein